MELFSAIFVLFLVLVYADTADDAHNAATNYMIQQSAKNETSFGDIPIIFSASDGDKLVVGIDISAMSQNEPYTEAQIQEALQTNATIEIKYMPTISHELLIYPVPETSDMPDTQIIQSVNQPEMGIMDFSAVEGMPDKQRDISPVKSSNDIPILLVALIVIPAITIIIMLKIKQSK